MYAVKVFRGTFLESSHIVHIAVADAEGKLLYSYGNPVRPTFARSAMKPFQAVPLVETGAARHFSFDDADLAVCCASHSGEPAHRQRVLSILQRAGQTEAALQCGTHIPRDQESYKEWIRQGRELTPVFSNCSGKHAGMIAACVHMGEDVATYCRLEHPHQRRILEAISDLCEVPEEEIGIGIDGCGVPVHRLPLANIALGFARLADPQSVVRLKEKPERASALERIRNAMLAHPEMVAGKGRFDTDLMRAYRGRIVAKTGAEGVQCLGDLEAKIGIAIKVEDGASRAARAAAMEVLRQLGIGGAEVFEELQRYAEPRIKNMRNEAVGTIRTDFRLEKNG